MPDSPLQVKPKTKPNYFTFLREDEKGRSAVLEMAENKENFEVVSFLKIDRPRAELYKKNTRREGGEFLITKRSEPQGAAHLSALASDNKSITEKEREVNQRAQGIKKAVISEINKREIENKRELLNELQEAKDAQSVFAAAEKLLDNLRKEYEKTDEGQAEKRELDVPSTNWQEKKILLLKDLNDLLQNQDEKTKRAQPLLKEESRAKLNYRAALSEEEKAAVQRAKAFLKENYTPRIIKLLERALRAEEHLYPKDINRMIAHTAGMITNFNNTLKMQLDGFIRWAETAQRENYNRYIWRKLDTLIGRRQFEKSGNVKKRNTAKPP